MQSVQVEAAKIDREQMDALLQRFERPLLQYATRILGDSDRARDVVQETFIKFQNEDRVELDHAPAKWLFTVCRNGALNICRKEKRMTYLDQELLETRESEQPAPYEKLEAKEASGFLLRILGTLPPRQQEVLQLKFQNDLSYHEIGEITQLSASNVGVMIHNALKTLRHRYGQASKDFLPFTPRIVS
jgi:RNA polymerase sigma-70 factor (ECF subfamily)